MHLGKFTHLLRSASLSISFVALLLQVDVSTARGQAGQTITVADSDVAGLITAIQTLNASGGGTIDLASGGTYSVTAASDWWYGPNAFPAISSAITINGNGATVSRASGSPKFRFFFVSSGFSTLPAGTLTLKNLTLTGGLAQGGSGGSGITGGGGGAGLGGAIYNQGTLTLSSVTFASNAALGGSSGTGSDNLNASGAGGGLGGNGAGSGGAYGYSAGGGGGGFKTDGGSPGYDNGAPGGSFLGNEGGSSCDGVGTSSYGGNGGNALGSDNAGGGGGGFMVAENGGNAYTSSNQPYFIGGGGAQGGGAGGDGAGLSNGLCGGAGGAFGGGGGGGGEGAGSGGGGGVGGGGGGGGLDGYGSNGGFGGGGGSGAGTGGFGAGGGGFYYSGGGGGGSSVFAGGVGVASFPNGANGGGGAGLGGAIFNHLGTLTATNSSFTSNSATGMGGGGTASGFGGAIFNLDGYVTITGGAYSSDSALDSSGNDDGSAFLYNLSHNAGNSAGNQTPSAIVGITGLVIAKPSDLVTNQVNGSAVTGLPQTITITAPASPANYNGGAGFTVSATSSSGLPVILTCTSNEAVIQGNGSQQLTVYPLEPLTLVFKATQAGSSTYVPATASYTLLLAYPASTPVISLAAGFYPDAQMVTISDSTPGSAIYYTIDGTTPTTASTAYSGAISVTSSETLLAVAAASGYANSAVATAVYSISKPVASGDVAGLISAIQTFNAIGGGTIDLAPGGTYTISAPSDWWYGPNAFPAVSSAITINGNGATIIRAPGSPRFRFFFVSSGFSTLPAGTLTLNDLTLTGGLAQGGHGGDGGGGGGGGAGLGGAIYNQGTLNLSGVAFASNTATGGGAGTALDVAAAGAGGGLGGNGASTPVVQSYAGGGGGGFKSDGITNAINPYLGGPGGSFLGNEGGSVCTGAGTSSYGGNGGNALADYGAGGGGGGFMPGANGGNAYNSGNNSTFYGGSGAQGGGSGKGSFLGAGVGTSVCGGGGGAFGGGGAAADGTVGSSNPGGGGGGVGGGGGGQGGQGGFGGGGAGQGGLGGFGGGGGAGSSGGNAGSVFAGGAGGAGLGGAIFNHLGTLTATNSTFTSNSADGAGGNSTASGFGGAIFNLDGYVSITGGAYTSDTALDSNGNDDTSAFLYNLSHNAGNSAANQTPTANVTFTGLVIAKPTDVVNNQVNGTATVAFGQTITFTAPESPAPYNGGAGFTVSATSSSGLPVSLTCNTNEAVIVGSGSQQLTVYPLEPITLVFKATQAGNSGFLPATATLTLVIANPTATPSISLATGTYTGAQTVTIRDDTPNASIFYTLGGATPTANSTPYLGAITINTSETLSAIATSSGQPISGETSATYSLVTPSPTFNPANGSSVSPLQSIAIVDSIAGATIYYVSGPQGTVPTTQSPVFYTPIPVGSLYTSTSGGMSYANLSAIAQAPGMAVSASAGGLFPLLTLSPTPTFSPAAGDYPTARMVTLSAPLSVNGAQIPVAIFYTTDGSPPTVSSNHYNGPFAVSSTETVQAISLAEEGPYAFSAVSTALYAIVPQAVSWAPSTLHLFSGAIPGTGVLDATDSIPATIAYTLTLQPSGAPFAINPSSVLTQGNYLLTANVTPNDTTNYAATSDTINFSVQNMNVFVGNSAGSVTSFYNGGTLQTQAVPGGGIGAAVDPAGNVWSISADGTSLTDYTNDGTVIGTFSDINLSAATAIAIDAASHLWVTHGANSISVYAQDGRLLGMTTSNALNLPTASSIDVSGNVWIANSGGATITELLGGATPTVPLATGINSSEPAGKP